ncbi:MAG: hypothetical protein LBU05_06505, partial [Bifidobacteriaceae bacterium]|nr:hypothetical protein [Bifidobacteriaceae bacterium]
MAVAAGPEFTESWPQWAQFLIGAPLRIVVILVATWIVLAIVHRVNTRGAARVAKRPPRAALGGRAGDT